MHKLILITGATGFIGKALEARLRAEGYSVRRAVRHESIDPDEIKCTLNDNVDLWRKALDGVDCVFHLAWSTVPSTANIAPMSDATTNLLGTISLLEAIKHTRGIPLIFASSGGTVYGIPETTPITESHPLRPGGVYGATKVAAENYLMAYRRQFGVDARILRLSNPFGPGQNTEGQLGAATVFAWRALLNRPIEIWGDGSVVRDYLFISDCVSALIAAMKIPASRLQEVDPIFNVGSGQGVSLAQIVEVIGKALHRKIEIDFQSARTFDIPINVLDVERAKRILNWSPTICFEEGIRLTLESFAKTMSSKHKSQ
ncbi:NAD-dependent epimerase/dehydratase family protein [Paraburkholderia strydomiana]|uniref:NAD-dependent epimerase/dehydratase family protein n=1 Tax=Paraburkholderia strydomiana TaxID=1245417 RepID=UPI0038B79CFA